MIQRFIIFFMICFAPAHFLLANVQFQQVITDLKNPSFLTDGKEDTAAVGKKGTNTIILQIGTMKYIKTLGLSFKGKPNIKKISILASENFIVWSTIIDNKDLSESKPTFNLKSHPTIFLKIVLLTETDFSIQEIILEDDKAPKNEISGIQVRELTETTALIQWKTKIDSQDQFSFSQKVNGERQTIIEVSFRKDHEVRLKGLKRGTDYNYQIVSQSPDGIRMESPSQEFRTKGVALPEFWELKAESISPFNAKIRYRTNVPTTMEVYLGRTAESLVKVLEDKILQDTKEFDLQGLQPETAYFYKLALKDSSGNVLLTTPVSFITPAYNIALGKKAAGTFNFIDEEIKKRGFGTTTADKAVDGNLSYFGGMALSYNANNADQYIIIDLEKPEPIKRLEIFWWALSFSKDYRIDISDDGLEWKTIKDRLDAETGHPTHSPAGDFLVSQTVEVGKTARLVRLFVKAGAKRGTLVKKWDPRSNLYLVEIAVIKDVK